MSDKVEVKKKELTLITPKFETAQLLYLMQRTPKRHIYERPAKGGGKWKFVTGAYVKKTLNYVFGWNWDFTIVDKGREDDIVWVQGRLTVRDNAGNAIVKEQFGRAEVKFVTKFDEATKKKVKTDSLLDYGNDLKAAATDCLKKCANELGIASDVYNEMEFIEIKREDFINDLPTPNEPATTPPRPQEPDNLDSKIGG